MQDEDLRQAAAVNPKDKFELVFRGLLERLFVERMDQNEEIFVRYMNDLPFRDMVKRLDGRRGVQAVAGGRKLNGHHAGGARPGAMRRR
ncbi:MAG: hypothetical protein KatS3mg123_2636 [Burkholderiales bacterium]|nr:MAG: hypothetical protein KatS3mg123_2636 [Burkholderiales bacterium]